MSQSFNYIDANRYYVVSWRRIAVSRQQGKQAQEFCVAVNTVGRVSPLRKWFQHTFEGNEGSRLFVKLTVGAYYQTLFTKNYRLGNQRFGSRCLTFTFIRVRFSNHLDPIESHFFHLQIKHKI